MLYNLLYNYNIPKIELLYYLFFLKKFVFKFLFIDILLFK